MHRMKNHIPTLLVLLLLLPECSSREVTPGHEFTISREGDVTIALTTGGPKHTDELFRYEKALELKEDPEQPESLLYRPNGLLMDHDGTVYVNDAGSSQIAVFDAEGNYLRRIGRQGDGPGEFRQMDILGVRGGVISTYDVALNRASRFHTDGTLIDVTMIPVEARSYYGSSLVTAMHLEEEGRKILIQYRMGTESGSYQLRAAVLGAGSDTLWSIATPRIKAFYNVAMPGGTSGMISPIQYGPFPALTYHPDYGLLVSDGDKPELSLYGTDGTLRRRIRIDLSPEPVSDEERAQIMDRYDQRLADAEGQRREMIKAQRDAVVIASVKPCWMGAEVDDAGFFWLLIAETQQDRRDAGGNLYRVLSPEGEYLGDSRWPTDLTHARLSRGHLLFNVVNEDTGETVPTVFRIVPAVPGLDYP